ncbi:MAG: PT domain-containing protein, partial [SAR324 cluster bacterium]|nr:PT domain-containing protein [SAR324 cluster bacterium]
MRVFPLFNSSVTDGPTNRPTNQPTNQPTDGRTDKASLSCESAFKKTKNKA